MTHPSEPAPQPMPRWAQALLTRRLPCAALLFLMQSAIVWMAAGLGQVPVLGTIAVSVGVAANLLSPAVVAIVTLGGGAGFALQVAGLAAAAVFVASGFRVAPAVVSFALYGLAPMLGAMALMRPEGMRRSAVRLLSLMALAVAGAFVAASAFEQTDAATLAHRLVEAMFDAPDAADAEMAAAVAAAKRTLALSLPGLLAAGLWLAWWADVLLARSFAERHGFFRGDRTPASALRFSPALGIAFAAALAVGQLAEGGLRFWAVNASILFGAAIAADGVLLMHGVLAARGMHFALMMMYLLLLLSSAMIVPFLLLGLIDLWADLRKRFRATTNGGE